MTARENPSVPLNPLWFNLLLIFFFSSTSPPPSLCFWGLPPHLFISKSLFVLINRKYSNKLMLALVLIQGKQLRASTYASIINYIYEQIAIWGTFLQNSLNLVQILQDLALNPGSVLAKALPDDRGVITCVSPWRNGELGRFTWDSAGFLKEKVDLRSAYTCKTVRKAHAALPPLINI